ncbi:tetratricopeptide repeat protein [Citrifermentans bremense]|uniref:tetratricopeptide repeat protein n=1 Tax=Citrifermentans bremense TaxID=60035 RepID=UPI0003F7B29A|nr:tetratricopeptide repeat protein [Citrifermentans bremense]
MTKTSLAAAALIAAFTCAAPAQASTLDEGIIQYRVENFEEALALLQKARAEEPKSSLAAFYLGMARKQGGDIPGAIKDLTDAATLKPPVLDSYLELADAWHVQGDDEKALQWANRSESEGVNPARSAFFKGIILSGLGQREEAVAAFEKAKRLDPSLTQSAQLQIAMVMAGSRKLTRARDALRAVVAADPNSEIAGYAKEYEQSFTRILDSYQPLHLTLGLNYLYDDNAISSPSNPGARAQIGNPTGQRDHAFMGNFRLDYTPLLENDYTLSAQYLVQSTKYGDTDTAEENPSTVINSLTVNLGHSFGNSIFSVPISLSHVLLKEKAYQSLATVRPTWSWQAAPQHILQAGASFTRRDMLQDPLVQDEDRDANIGGASAGYIFSYGELGGMAALRYDFSYDDARGVNWKNRGHRYSANGVIPLAAALKLNLSGEVATQDYFKTNTVFDVQRRDTTWFGTAGLSWNLNRNLALLAQYSHTKAESNIKVYDYSRNTFSTGIEFSF